MIYLVLNENQIKILYLKKSLLGHYDIVFYEKKYQMSFLKNGQLVNPDLTASAIKEALTLISEQQIKDRDVTLILPQESFEFLRSEVPEDMAPVVLETYIREKARAQLKTDLENCYYDQIMVESEGKREMSFYALEDDQFRRFQEPFNLLDLKVKAVVPESLCYYKLFEKTLRAEKKENVLYASYDGSSVTGYVYDSFGLKADEKWRKELKEKDDIEQVLKQKAASLEKAGTKLNRLILSGEESETIRQDTFTKNVGVWTNPLKRIMPHFYADYLKMFTSSNAKSIPYLQFDACIGAFILNNENKDFHILGRKVASFEQKSFRTGGFSFPWKPIGLFAAAFILAIGAVFGIYRLATAGPNIDVGSLVSQVSFTEPTPTPSPTPEPTATPTPTPEPERDTLRIRVLNGSGTPGLAGEVRDLLRDAGYSDIVTGNADSFDFETTEIQLKEEREEFFEVLQSDISENATVEDFNELDEDDAADAVIIVGTDWE